MVGNGRSVAEIVRRGRVPALAVGLALVWSLLVAVPGQASELEEGCPAELLPVGSFEDVDADGTHAAAVECLVFHQVTEGVADGRYGPSRAVTRGQMATFLVRVVDGSDADLPSAGATFDDVDANSVHAEAIERLAAAEIAQGRGDGTFGPDGSVTREQMASFLRRAYEFITETTLDQSTSPFDDIAGSTHQDNINAVAAAGFAQGVTETRYAPDRVVNRAQMGSFLARVIDRLASDDRFQVPGEPATYLSEMDVVDNQGSWRDSSVTADAVDYGRSIRIAPAGAIPVEGNTFWREYNLSRDFDVFRAVIGMTDTSETGSRAEFTVTVDGREALSEQVNLAETEAIEVDVTDASRIRVQVTGLNGRPIGAFGNARLLTEGGSDDVDRFTERISRSPQVYLSEANVVDNQGSWSDTSVTVDSQDYGRSIRIAPAGAIPVEGNTFWREYNLSRDFDVFRAVIGVTDSSETGSRAEFTVTVDGREVLSEQLGLAESEEIELDVSDAFRVKVQVTGLEGRSFGAFGDAHFLQLEE